MLMWHGVLNENAIVDSDLNTWSTVGRTIWKALKIFGLIESVLLSIFKKHINSSSLFSSLTFSLSCSVSLLFSLSFAHSLFLPSSCESDVRFLHLLCHYACWAVAMWGSPPQCSYTLTPCNCEYIILMLSLIGLLGHSISFPNRKWLKHLESIIVCALDY